MMSDPDLGMRAGPNGNANEDTISNQSGDTFLLNDDSQNVNTYADILRRETSTPVQVTPGSLTDEEFLGYGRRLTNFERAHFTKDNVTPGRPCTAYFNAGYFVDSKAVFEKLTQFEIPRESVLCLQRRPSGDILLTFTNEAVKRKFVSCVSIRFDNSTSVINDDDMPLTFLNIYDAPYELSDEALSLRLEKYCIVHSTRRGKLGKSHVNNGIRHYRVQIKEPLPTYLRFGKFLVRLSHDGQQHTCRRCNRAGHFANECQNVVCFNCDELGHQSRECGEAIRCCICKSVEHRARHCPYSWHQSSSAPSSDNRSSDPSSGGNVAASAGDPSSGPSSGGDVAASASDHSFPSRRADSLRDVFPSSDVSDSVLLAALGASLSSSTQPSGVSSDPHMLNSQGYLHWENVAFGASVPNPPGPPSSADDLMGDTGGHSSTPSADQAADLPVDPPVVPPSDPSPDPPVVSPSDPPVDLSSGPTDPPAVSPVLLTDVSSADRVSTDTSSGDHSLPPPVPSTGVNRSSRRRPAPMPAALEAVTRRPTRPSLPVSGKSGTAGPSAPPPGGGSASEEMDSQHSSLKRKQQTSRKKEDPKKGKH